MFDEYETLILNHTWSLMSFAFLTEKLGSKNEYSEKAYILKHQLRLRVVDYFETLVRLSSQLLLVSSRNWVVRQFDVHNAFLNGDLTEKAYIKQPAGFIHQNIIVIMC